MSCEDCKYRVKDYSTGTEDCMKYDEMTEEETQTYWTDGGSGCPYYEEDNYDMFAEDFSSCRIMTEKGAWMFNCAERDPIYNLKPYDYMTCNPHTLIGGSTGCGKSVMIDVIMYSLLTDRERGASPLFYLIDPKRVSLNKYRGLYGVRRYGCEYSESKDILEDVIRQMEYRYKIMQQRGEVLINAVDVYVVIDELADLLTMPQSRKEIKPLIQRIAQLGRAARIHLIAATQCPARKIIPAELTLNFTEKVALKCDTAIESRQLIGVPGAEQINQYGIAYLRTKGKLHKIEVPMIPDDEIQRAVDYLKCNAHLRIV